MDLNILNSGTPDSKNFLNIVCNSITCNEVIAPPLPNSSFNLNFTGQAPLTANLTNPCNALGIPNDDVNLAANTYTAPNDLNLFVSLQLSIYYPAVATGFSTTVSINVNGTPSYLTTGTQNPSSSIQGRYPLISTGNLSLSAGDVVSLSIISSGSIAGINYGNVSFSGSIF
jgi:hypothetical protein